MAVSIRFQQRELQFPLGWLVLALAGAALFISLGNWQWHRAAGKRAITQEFAAAASQVQPLGAQSLAALGRYVRLEVRGSYEPAHQFLLDNMSPNGQAGYEVLTPLRLQDGRWLLVNRGWVPLVERQRARLPDVSVPEAGEITLRGMVDDLPVPGLAAGRQPATATQGWPRVTSFPETADLTAALGHPLEPRQLLLAADESQGYVRNWQPASASFPPERHIAYAVQWWSLAALAMGLYVKLNLKRRHP